MGGVFVLINLLQSVCVTSFCYPIFLRIVISGISQGWCPGKRHASALETGIEAGYGCPARTSVCPEDRELARPRRAP